MIWTNSKICKHNYSVAIWRHVYQKVVDVENRICLVDSIMAAFPHPPIVIEGKPSPMDIQQIREATYGNAAAIISSFGGGQHGHLGLVLTPAEYAIQSQMPFVRLDNPGDRAIIPDGSTAAQIGSLERQYNANLQGFLTTENVDAALRNFLFACMQPLYYSALRVPMMGYSRVKALDVLQHLKQSYGTIDPRHLITNSMTLNEAWDPSSPFEMHIDCFEQAIAYALLGKQLFADDHVVNSANTLVCNTGMYFDTWKIWRAKAIAD